MKNQASLSYALFLLSRRSRTVFELQQKLLAKDFLAEEIAVTIGRLLELGLLDDQKYSENYVRDKLTIYRRGRYRIGLELRQKGVDKEIIEAALAQADEATELAAAQSLIVGKKRSWANLTERARFERSVKLLQRRGFSGSVIRQVISY